MNLKNTPIIFGEVLFDCFPDGSEKLGGAPFNVAWNLQAFGMSPLFVSRVGADDHGKRIEEKMRSWKMNTDYLQVDQSHPTGQVRIELAEGEPHFTILPEQAYDFISSQTIRPITKPAFIYHGSLAMRSNGNRKSLSSLKQEAQCPIFVDVNLRAPWWNNESVYQSIEDATWVKLNENELNTLFPGHQNLERRCQELLDRFELEAVFVTRGSKGAIACTQDIPLTLVEPCDNIQVIDTVGAGDAFSSVLLLGLTNNWPLETIIQRAQEFASAVVGLQGALSEDRDFYQTFTSQWELQ